MLHRWLWSQPILYAVAFTFRQCASISIYWITSSNEMAKRFMKILYKRSIFMSKSSSKFSIEYFNWYKTHLKICSTFVYSIIHILKDINAGSIFSVILTSALFMAITIFNLEHVNIFHWISEFKNVSYFQFSVQIQCRFVCISCNLCCLLSRFVITVLLFCYIYYRSSVSNQ